jgi:hypothetical protein
MEGPATLTIVASIRSMTSAHRTIARTSQRAAYRPSPAGRSSVAGWERSLTSGGREVVDMRCLSLETRWCC